MAQHVFAAMESAVDDRCIQDEVTAPEEEGVDSPVICPASQVVVVVRVCVPHEPVGGERFVESE